MRNSRVLLGFVLFCSILLLNCARTKRPISRKELQKEKAELVIRAKEGNKEEFEEVENVLLRFGERSKEDFQKERWVYFGIKTNADTIFVPILIKALEKETDKDYLRALLDCVNWHYEYSPEKFYRAIKARLSEHGGNGNAKAIGYMLIDILYFNDDLVNLFPILESCEDKDVKVSMLKKAALTLWHGRYKSLLGFYPLLAGAGPPCRIDDVAVNSIDLAKIVIQKENLNENEKELFLKNLNTKKGIFWTLIGLLREKDERINNALIEWVDSAPLRFDQYKPMVLIKLKGAEGSLNLLEELGKRYSSDCYPCFRIIKNLIDSLHVEEEAPQDIRGFAHQLIVMALSDTIVVKGVTGEKEAITIPDLRSVRKSDTAYVYLSAKLMEEVEVRGKNVIVTNKRDCYWELLASGNKNWGLSVTLRWYGDYVYLSLGTKGPPRAVLGGGWCEYLLKRVDGEIRLLRKMDAVIF